MMAIRSTTSAITSAAMLAVTTLVLSSSLNATTLVEDFSAPFPQWESDWLGLNTNIQNFYGAGSSQGTDFLWITDGDAIVGAGEVVGIDFEPAFGSSLTSFSIDIDTFVDTSIQVYDGSGGVILDFIFNINLGYENVFIQSANGISGFSLFGQKQIEGNTAIDNVVVTTAVVPAPAAVWLFGSGLLGLFAVIRRKV